MSEADPLNISKGRSFDEIKQACDCADKKLNEISENFDFLLSLSPTNTPEAMRCWFRGGCEGDPDFHYRDLEFDPAEIRRELHAIELGNLHEPLIEGLLLEKRQELDLQLTLLERRCSKDFLLASEQLYGAVSDELHAAAKAILETVTITPSERKTVGAHELLAHAQSIIAHYQAKDAGFRPEVQIRDDITGLLVSYPRLYIDADSKVAARRADPLLSHELSIHMVTGFNGDCQDFSIFETGLAGYEEIQEGLGVFAEWAVGGLYAARLRLIAGRVIAVHSMLAGADFTQCYRELRMECGLGQRTSFKLAARVYRSGGLAKDAIYLRGFFRVMEYIADEGDLTPYWLGKIAPIHIPVVRELEERGLIKPPRLIPEFLSRPDARVRIDDYRTNPSPGKWLSPEPESDAL
ncbi:flavohemoglobin expression-modulating QEGLA motif protein [Sphingomicrobium flavum]|uniref:flavohemoglobin expression-modulating QEGLA motif protein n=1 Tax=Sphingomicrobium flavum TaxID=1229164 RepID=UPI0021ADA390|nr:tyrosine/phenylalanine carboxypeptidase domain-containing protein [Sphingomicrobium flavum]